MHGVQFSSVGPGTVVSSSFLESKPCTGAATKRNMLNSIKELKKLILDSIMRLARSLRIAREINMVEGLKERGLDKSSLSGS